MALSHSARRKAAVDVLDRSLDETGGSSVFSVQSAIHVVHAVKDLEKSMRGVVRPAVFKNEEGLQFDDDKLQQNFNKPAIAGYFGTAVDILIRAVDQLQGAVQLQDELAKLKDENCKLMAEKIEDQKRIMELQQCVIDKKDSDFSSVRETVQQEVRSYATVVEKTCASALAPKQMKIAVKSANVAEMKDRNLMIYGLVEEEEENLQARIKAVLVNLEEKPVHSIPCRVGVAANGKIRPVKMTLASRDNVLSFLRKAKQLKNTEGCENIYLSPDRTRDERDQRKKLVDELKRKRSEDPGKTHLIKNNVVISFVAGE